MPMCELMIACTWLPSVLLVEWSYPTKIVTHASITCMALQGHRIMPMQRSWIRHFR